MVFPAAPRQAPLFPRIPRRMPFLLLLALPTLIAGGGRLQLTPPPDPVETGAWFKILGLRSGAPDPVVLSEAEVNALLGSAQLGALFAERAGVSGLSARLFPEEVRVRGKLEAARLGPVLGPLAPPAAGPAQPFQAVIRLRGAGGAAEATILRGMVAGIEVPPEMLTEAVGAVLLGVLGGSGADGEEPVRTDALFPLPPGLEGLQVRSGEVRLTPAPR